MLLFHLLFYLKFDICCVSSSDSGGIFRLSGAFCVDSALLSSKITPWGPTLGQNKVSKKNGCPGFPICGFILNLTYVFVFLMILIVLSDSLALSASIPLFFVPKYPPGVRFWTKAKFFKNLKMCLRSCVFHVCGFILN